MRLVPGVLAAVLFVVPQTSLAQTPEPQWSRFFVEASVSGGAASVARARDFRSVFVTAGELGSAQAFYPKPSLSNPFAALDLGGGVMFNRLEGIGISYSRTPYENAVQLMATIPHPTFLNSPATATSLTNEALKRTEDAIHLFVVGVAPLPRLRGELRIFGGPSLIRYKAEMVRTVLYAQKYNSLTPQNAITIEGIVSEQIREQALGLHIGGDFTYYFTSALGIGTGVRVSRATVKVGKEPLSAVEQKIRVGNAVGFVGLRYRFGG